MPFVLPWPFSGLFDGFLVFLRKHRFLPSNKVAMDVSKALEPQGIKLESIQGANQVKPKICHSHLQFRRNQASSFGETSSSNQLMPREGWFRRNHSTARTENNEQPADPLNSSQFRRNYPYGFGENIRSSSAKILHYFR